MLEARSQKESAANEVGGDGRDLVDAEKRGERDRVLERVVQMQAVQEWARGFEREVEAVFGVVPEDFERELRAVKLFTSSYGGAR